MLNQFKKKERIHKKNELDLLFSKGKSFLEHPFRVIHYSNKQADKESRVPLKVAFSVPKKRFKNAVDRNLLKRRMREAYRRNKNNIIIKLNENQQNVLLMVIYNSNESLDYESIEHKIILILQRLQVIYAENHQ